MIFTEIAPFVIAITVIICILIALRVQKIDIFTIDGFLALVGCCLGLALTCLNLIYSNNYLITIGPLVSIASMVYLRFRDTILTSSDLDLNLSLTANKIFRLLFWASILIALASYYTSQIYNISLGFYIGISLAVTSLGMEILTIKLRDNNQVYGVVAKIFLISLIFRASTFFISSNPVGSDPWVHAQIIEYMFNIGSTNIPDALSPIYHYSPLMHLYAIAGILLGGYSTKVAMFIIGSVLVFSTIFVYLLIKKITNNQTLALLAMLLLNFSDFYIQWSVLVIAMTFGIAIYSLLLYLILTRRKYEKLDVLLIVFIFTVLVMTHTVSAFIALVSIISLYVGMLVYRLIYGSGGEKLLLNYKVCLLLIAILVGYWSYSGNNFFWSESQTLIYSLTVKASFLGRSDITMVGDRLDSILNIAGFLIMIFFGIIGCLAMLSKKYSNRSVVIIGFMSLVLFFIFFAFPVMGIRTILPYRWPAFIYTGFVMFTVIGLIGMSTLTKKNHIVMPDILMAILFIFAFFMITNDIASPPTPIYGSGLNENLFWTDSEMSSFKTMNDLYNGTIMADLQTCDMPFQIYLNRSSSTSLSLTPLGTINWDDMDHDLIVWRQASIIDLMQAQLGDQYPNILLGQQFKYSLDENFSSVYDVGTTRGYLKSPGE
jgi:hypothetical protein